MFFLQFCHFCAKSTVLSFLVACPRLYSHCVGRSVGLSVHWSVRRSVGPSVPLYFFFCKVAYRVACARLMVIGLVSIFGKFGCLQNISNGIFCHLKITWDKPMDGRTDGRTDRRMDGPTTDGLTDGQRDGQKDGHDLL